MRWSNSSELVSYAITHQRALAAAGKTFPVPELPRIEQLGTVAGVTLTRVEFEGRRWLEATCQTT